MISGRLIEKEYFRVYIAAIVFIALNSIFTALEIFYLPVLPFVIIIILLAFTSLDKLLLLTVFFVPFSVQLSRLIGKTGVDLSLPTEPILTVILVICILKFLKGERIDRRIMHHPVTIAIYINLGWIFISSITSTMPFVSFKFFLSRVWFVIPFYFIAAQMFQDPKNINRYLWAYILPLVIVIIYVIVRHSDYGLNNQQAAHFVVKPFYNDHTSYGAVLAMLLPVLAGFFFAYPPNSKGIKYLILFLLMFFSIAIILSYTRAAWVSLVVGALIWCIIKLRIRWTFLMAGTLLIFFAIYSFRTEIYMKLEKNKQVSSGKLTEHVLSVINIRNDDSNLERINRWSCAWRMFKEKPFFGWGPGTYMFQYAPFQLTAEKTRISTNAGTLGNAHSEYLGPLSESGVFGAFSFIAIIILSLKTGIRVYFKTQKRHIRVLTLAILLGLVTYYIHGVMNNFLDTDKVSALFWGFTAILVAMDIYQKKKNEEEI